jgi:Flp pilus assembly protein TadD
MPIDPKKHKDALVFIKNAIEINDRNSEYYMLAGLIRIQLKSIKEACNNFKTAADLKELNAIEYIYEHCI